MQPVHEIVIEPCRRWWRIPWREIVEYRDLLVLLIRRDFTARYKQTVLGPAWFVITPFVTTVVFTIIFGKVARIPTDRLPPLLFYMSGTMAWSYFAQCFNSTSTTLLSNAGLFGKVYFPRLIVPLSRVCAALIGFALQLTMFILFWCYFKWFTPAGSLFHLQPFLAMLPFLLALSAALGLGTGLWMSALTAKYRDFTFVVGFLVQIWMYATPIVYPLSSVPERWRWVSLVNPMTAVVEGFRWSFFGVGVFEPLHLAATAATAFVLLLSGIMVFARTERTFIDTV